MLNQHLLKPTGHQFQLYSVSMCWFIFRNEYWSVSPLCQMWTELIAEDSTAVTDLFVPLPHFAGLATLEVITYLLCSMFTIIMRPLLLPVFHGQTSVAKWNVAALVITVCLCEIRSTESGLCLSSCWMIHTSSHCFVVLGLNALVSLQFVVWASWISCAVIKDDSCFRV